MQKHKILIIDDEEAVWKSISLALKNDEYELLFVQNGKEGFKMLNEHKPELIILDLKMPVMNGTEFLEKIKLGPQDPYDIIVFTGHGNDEDVEKCFELGVSSFLRKPFNFYELSGSVKHSIRLKQYEKELKKHRDNLEDLVKERAAEIQMINQQLETSLSYNEQIIQSMTDPLIVISPKGDIRTVNKTICNLLGYDENELLGKPVSMIFPDEANFKGISDEDLIKELFSGHVEKILVTKDGREVFFFLSGSPIFNNNGELEGIVCVAQDITTRKKMEKDFLDLDNIFPEEA